MRHAYKLLLVIFLLVSASLLSAQNSDTRILSIGMGTLFGYNLDSSNLGTAQELHIGFGLSDTLEAGFHFITGDGVAGGYPDFRLFSLSYAASPAMGLVIYGGQNATLPVGPAAGLGYYLNLFRNQVSDTLSTILKLRVEYLISQGTPPERGLLTVGLQGKIAF